MLLAKNFICKKVRFYLDNSEFMLIFAISNDMCMKTYLYFATEENCFETEKFTTENPLADIKSFLADSYVQVQEAETASYQTDRAIGLSLVLPNSANATKSRPLSRIIVRKQSHLPTKKKSKNIWISRKFFLPL